MKSTSYDPRRSKGCALVKCALQVDSVVPAGDGDNPVGAPLAD